ncbi:hypothetical protein BC628DRAFT_1359821 [Trametes gibbosa]|nr:hypothetical protein BC628DRAFT_1359821 [Trametes gibbosa]
MGVRVVYAARCFIGHSGRTVSPPLILVSLYIRGRDAVEACPAREAPILLIIHYGCGYVSKQISTVYRRNPRDGSAAKGTRNIRGDRVSPQPQPLHAPASSAPGAVLACAQTLTSAASAGRR